MEISYLHNIFIKQQPEHELDTFTYYIYLGLSAQLVYNLTNSTYMNK